MAVCRKKRGAARCERWVDCESAPDGGGDAVTSRQAALRSSSEMERRLRVPRPGDWWHFRAAIRNASPVANRSRWNRSECGSARILNVFVRNEIQYNQ